jgi:putative aminopeptidase FrvX
VQKEVGLRGTNTSAYDLDPQICIATDVGHATDYLDGEVDPIVRRVMELN